MRIQTFFVYVTAIASMVSAAPQVVTGSNQRLPASFLQSFSSTAPQTPQRFVAGSPQTPVAAQPEEYVALGVLEPESNDVGPYDRIVAATIDVLPEMAELFENIANDPRHPNDPRKIQAIMNGFMPITRRVILANNEVEGRRWAKEDQYRFNAAAAVMPSVFSFMDKLRDNDFFGQAQRNIV